MNRSQRRPGLKSNRNRCRNLGRQGNRGFKSSPILGFETLEKRLLLAANIFSDSPSEVCFPVYRDDPGAEADFGDAPAPYPTLISSHGAQHSPSDAGPRLGALVRYELDGQPSIGADGDGDEEDGVNFLLLRVGQLDAEVVVNVQQSVGKLDAWIDFNGDGSWGGGTEQIFDSVAVSIGNNTLKFDVPSTAVSGQVYARFRVSSDGNLGPGGETTDGEVEDYRVEIFSPGGAANFGKRLTINNSIIAGRSITTSDVDGDGDMDIVATEFSQSPVWYEQRGGTVYSKRSITSTPQGNNAFASTADMDGDGDLDIVIASPDYNRVTVFENDGTPANGGWNSRVITESLDSISFLDLADFDGDGDLDIVAGGASIQIYENPGSWSVDPWAATQVMPPGSVSSNVAAVDLDRDGVLDVVASDGNEVIWFKGTGELGFEKNIVIQSNVSPGSLSVADMDGDADTDILIYAYASESNAASIFLLDNDGTQNFSRTVIPFNGGFDVRLMPADLDGDRDMDIVVSNRTKTPIVLQNLGDKSFESKVLESLLSSSNDLFDVTVADMDQDGDLDVLGIGFRGIG